MLDKISNREFKIRIVAIVALTTIAVTCLLVGQDGVIMATIMSLIVYIAVGKLPEILQRGKQIQQSIIEKKNRPGD